MNENRQPSYENPQTAEWLCGYRTGLADAVAIVDALGGPNFQGLSAPILLRIKTRLMELERTGRHRAA